MYASGDGVPQVAKAVTLFRLAADRELPSPRSISAAAPMVTACRKTIQKL
jgi:hypothetical protein